MTKLKYKISARATILLGREGVSKADGAVVELIKNTYDADADFCFLCIDKEEGVIYLYDNGTGMDIDTIQDCWMLIGTPNKKNEYESDKNRIKSGEKGIGRFALDRLGASCIMYTKMKTENQVLEWTTNWSDFEDTDKTLDEIEAEVIAVEGSIARYIPVEMQKNISQFVNEITIGNNNEKIRPYDSGTLFIIKGLRDEWNEDKKNKLVENLNTLLPPKEQSEFFVCVMQNLRTDYDLIENTYSEEYDYKINAKFDGDKFTVVLNRNEFDLNKIPEDVFKRAEFMEEPFRKKDFEEGVFEKTYSIGELLKTKNETLIAQVKSIGAFSFDYTFMKITMTDDSKEIFYYKEIGKSRKAWLDQYGGIKIYRDNFFVRPYGDSTTDAFDWLGLNARKAKSPAGIAHEAGRWHVRNTQSQGTIFISRVHNSVLLDKSSREGIIENDYFSVLKNVLISIIAVFEKDRAYIGKGMRAYSDFINDKETAKEKAKEISKSIIKETNKKEENNETDKEVLAKAVKYYEEERDELQSEIQQLKALATSGLITSTVAHDLKSINAILVSRIDSLKKSIDRNDENFINRQLSDLRKNDEFLKSWLTIVSSQVRKDKRKRRKYDIYDTIVNIVNVMEPILARKKVNVHIESDKKIVKRRLFQSDFESIFYNLIINSIEAFEDVVIKQREIKLRLSADDKTIVLSYSDNGPGINDIFKNPNEIFDYGTTTKKDKDGNDIGTGMGMYIVASTLREYNAKNLLKKKDTGFEMEMIIPRGE